MKIKISIVIVVVALAFTQTTFAQGVLRNDPNRPTGLISRDLGVTQAQFIACFSGVNPARSHAPSGRTQQVNKAVLLPCLQKVNSSITNRALDNVMDSYRPEGPMKR